MARTLLETFIESKARGYSEPSRKGRPRGEALGFSSKKYLASLHLLTAEKQISIAMEQGLSYGLLRKWKTEEPFKALVTKHRRDFAAAFINQVLEEYRLNRSAHGLAHQDRPSGRASGQDDCAFRDCGDYSPDLLAEILRTVVDHAQRAEKERSFSEAFTVLSAFLNLISPRIKESAVDEIVRAAGIELTALTKGLKLGVLERVREMLLKEDISAAERGEAHYLLTELGAII